MERPAHPGEIARADDARKPLLKLAQLDVLHVEAILPVTAYGRIRKGMSLDVMPEDPIGGTYPAKVRVVDRVLDAPSGTFGVRLELPNPGLKLPAGVRCRVTVPGMDDARGAGAMGSLPAVRAVPTAGALPTTAGALPAASGVPAAAGKSRIGHN